MTDDEANWALVKIGLVLFFLTMVVFGCMSQFEQRYDTGSVGVGVSGIVNSYGEIDLKKDLDASKLPDVVKEAYKAGANQKLKGVELQTFVVRHLSQSIRDISTVDLNGDGTTDPILVVPEGDNEHMTFSIRVPDPSQVKKYPKLSNAAAWEDIGTNKSIELVAVTAVPQIESGKLKGMNFESRPNSHFYSSSEYYRSSFASNLFTYMIVRDLFFRPMWFGSPYYGWYGGYYSPYSVRNVHRTRSTKVSKYSSGKSSFGRMTTQSGTIPKRSKNSQMLSKKSFSASKNVRKNIGGKGFGRSASSRSSSRSGFGRSKSRSSSRGWFSSRSSSGGFRWGK